MPDAFSAISKFFRIPINLIRLEIFFAALLYTDKERFTIHSTMKDIEKKLPSKMFMRSHRSFILNLNKINSIDSLIVNIENSDKKIPIGGSYREGLFKRLNLA